jgi:phenylacetate-CoA ligase
MLVEPETDGEESSILVTKLHADAFPMIRYRIGDRARFPAGARAGHPAFRLLEILGRELEMVRVGDDRWISGTVFPHMFKDYPIADYQVHQAMDGSVEVRLVPTAHEIWTGEVERRFVAALAGVLGNLPLRITVVADIARTASNKRRPVISELARTRG